MCPAKLVPRKGGTSTLSQVAWLRTSSACFLCASSSPRVSPVSRSLSQELALPVLAASVQMCCWLQAFLCAVALRVARCPVSASARPVRLTAKCASSLLLYASHVLSPLLASVLVWSLLALRRFKTLAVESCPPWGSPCVNY